MLKGCLSDRDLKTLEDWANYAGVSYSTLTESCRLLGIGPHEARDLMRVLRAAVKAADLNWPLEALLDVSDRRTLNGLTERAGIGSAPESHGRSPLEILSRQHFVDPNNPGIRALGALFERAVKES